MGTCTNVNTCCNAGNGWSGSGRYAFILVLFILLVISGAAFSF